MKNRKYSYSVIALITALILVTSLSCEKDFEELELAKYPRNPEVFIDGFSEGLNYAAFGGSKVTAFDVDEEVKYEGTSSMKFEVPDFEDPEGAYAGGAYYTTIGRDLSSYDALTFWAKASKSATLDIVGFGNDLDKSAYQASILGVELNTNWQKVIIPIPDPSKLTAERGMFFYSEGPEEGKGYTFWIDEVKFEKLGTIAHPQPAILEGQAQTTSAETGSTLEIGGTYATFNMPTGIDQRIEVAPSYFTFASTDTTVAKVSETGVVSILDSSTVVITAKMLDVTAKGSLTIEASGALPGPAGPAPTPTVDEDSVISMFSNAYTDVTVDTWNTYWEYSTATTEEIQIDGDDVKRYRDLNFVGIEFSSERIDASDMTHFHLDIWTPDPTELPATFKVMLIDFGADGVHGGDDDSSHEATITSPTLATGSWVGLDLPLSGFTGLTSRANLAQLVLSGDIPTVYLDNVYFYSGEGGSVIEDGPEQAAPAPTHDAAEVISLFSNAYSDVTVDTWNPGWEYSTAVLQDLQIAGDDVKLYTLLNFVGIEFTSQTIDATDMKQFHIDIWTPDPVASAEFAVKLVDFGADGAYGGGDDSETEMKFTPPTLVAESWVSLDIPLSGLASKAHMAQLILEGNDFLNTVYIDNAYFHKGEGGGPESDATLSDLRVDGTTISGFSPGTLNYSVKLSEGTTVVPPVSVTENNANASSEITAAGSIPGTTSILVTAQDGSTQLTYTVDFSIQTGGDSWSPDEPIDFESGGFGADWAWNIFENDTNPPLEFVSNPDASGINTSATVAKITALQTGAPWVGCENAHGELGTTFDLSASNAIIKIMVYKTVVSDVGIKLANPAGGAQTEIKVPNTITNEWEELIFDFSDRIGNGLDGSTNIDQIIVFPDYNLDGRTSDNVVYFDNITFGSN